MSATAPHTGHSSPAERRGPQARPDVWTYPLDDELVVHDPSNGQTYALNPTAARIWALCDGSRPPRALARVISSTYALDYVRALADVRDLVDDLHTAGLLVVQ